MLGHVVFTFLAHSKTSLLQLPSVLISYLALRHIDHKLLQFSIAQLLKAQQSIVVPFVVGTISLAPDSSLQEAKDEDVVVGLRLLQLRPRVVVHLVD